MLAPDHRFEESGHIFCWHAVQTHGLALPYGVAVGIGQVESVYSTSMTFHLPRFGAPILLEEHIAALPPDGKAKGMFLSDVVARVESKYPELDFFSAAGVKRQRYLPFFDYPYADLMRLLVSGGPLLWPNTSIGECLRRLGHRMYDSILNAHFGRILLGALGKNLSLLAKVGTRAYDITVSFGSVTYEELGPGESLYRYRDIPVFIETYQVGMLEAAAWACDERVTIEIELRDLGNADIRARWGESC